MNFNVLRRFGVTCLFLGLSWSAHAALNLAGTVPIGPQVKVGKLDNGLTYYIQKNSRPERRLELRLVVKAGSILEDEDQLGLAHFAEHMAFNGSTHFKKHELVSYLQSIGLKFGADLNAYTSFNETVYILPIPTDKREDIEKAFLVLEDWAHGVSFNDADIDSERAIVLEELRNGKGAQDRMNKVLLPKIFSGSLYAKRLPIGTEESLKGFKFDAIKRFYKDWYRPNLMAVVVVGDIDPVDAQKLVEQHFSKLRNPEKERARSYPAIPVRKDVEAVVVTDMEATNNSMQVIYPVTEDTVVRTVGDYRQKLLERLFGMMLGQRMQELTQQSNPPFVGGGSSLNRLVPGYRNFSSGAWLGRQGVGPAMDALVLENLRARQFGFQSAELERSKKSMLRAVEQAHAEREKTDSGRYAAEYIRNFLEQETIPGISNELMYAQELLPTITLADVNAFAKTAIPGQSAKLLVYTGNAKEEGTPKEEQLLATAKLAEVRPVTAKEEKMLATSLMAKPPKAGTVVSETQNALLGTTELLLSNGVKVILKPTDFKNDEIIMGASRFGGQSLFGLADKFNAGYSSGIVASMGLAEFTPIDLQKMLAGKVVNVSTGLDTYNDVVHAASSQSDLETMLQLVHLKFAAPRRDEELFKSVLSRSQDYAKNAIARPESVFSDAVQTTLFNAHPRVWLTPRPADFEQLGMDRLRDIYQERFVSARGFTFIFVGSVARESALPLITTYLASLPTGDIKTAYADMGVRPVKGVVQKTVNAGSEPKSLVSIQFAGEAPFSEDEQFRVHAMMDVVNIRIIDELREKQTLIYGGGMGGDLFRTPYNHYQLGMQLPCGPDNVDKVVAAAFGEIDKLQQNGPDAADLAKVKQNWLIAHRKSLRENGYWLNKLQNITVYGSDPARIANYKKLVEAVTAADVQAAAKRYLRRDNYVQVVLHPEKK
ncbi:MAG: insulinase family protein [Rhodoferax sp.]|nr:insulinase family protein [Rhodoferax sp.]